MTAAVETVGLEKRYPGVEALRGVSLSIQRGEIFALLGPNGAGKTTWISIVCGLVRASAGQARVLGHDVVKDAMAARRSIGLVPQEINFDPFFTSREVLRFQMGYYGVPADEARIDELLQTMELGEKADVNARELSGGMRRRLLIAKALVHQPSVVFLDEPTAGVDVSLRRDLWDYVRKLRTAGTTIVLTTHYLEEAESLADRVGVIDRGSLITVDTPAALIARHGHKKLSVTYQVALPPLVDELRALGVSLDEERRRVELTLPDGDVAPTLERLARVGAIVQVRTEQPSLEDVFLALTEDEGA